MARKRRGGNGAHEEEIRIGHLSAAAFAADGFDRFGSRQDPARALAGEPSGKGTDGAGVQDAHAQVVGRVVEQGKRREEDGAEVLHGANAKFKNGECGIIPG